MVSMEDKKKMGNVYRRICYSNGIVKEENKVIELHKMCDCTRCKNKWGNRTRCNSVTAYAKTEAEADKLEFELLKWKCADGNKDLPVEYFNHINDILWK